MNLLVVTMGSFFEWLDSYSVGDKTLDEDHKKLIKLADTLLVSVNNHASDEIVGQIIAEAINYILNHYKREEEIMRKLDYPGLESHVAEHSRMADQVFQLNEKFCEGTLDVVSLSNLLVEMVYNHIRDEDKKLEPFIRGEES